MNYRTGLRIVTSKLLNIDTSRDFEVKTSAQYLNGPIASYIYLIWGMNEDNDQQRFGFSPDKKVWIGQASQHLKDGTSLRYNNSNESSIKEQLPNEIVVRKKGRILSYLINGKVITRVQESTFYGDRIGWLIPANMEVSIDYLSVKYLD